MSTHIAQAALAFTAAVALTFPTPEAAFDAVKTTFSGRQETIIRVEPEAVIVMNSGSAEPEVMLYDPVVDCVLGVSRADINALESCAEQLYSDLVEDGFRASVHGLQGYKMSGPKAAEMEAKRLAITKLCRAIWKAEDGGTVMRPIEACIGVVSGIEQTAELK